MSGADLQYAEMLARAGQTNGKGFDGSRLEQMSDKARSVGTGLEVKRWQAGDLIPTTDIINTFCWLIELNFGDPVPSWVPEGSLILRK